MDTIALINEINSKNDLISFAGLYSKDLNLDPSIDPYYFLLALMMIETSFGIQNVPRFEYGYSKSSLAYKKSRILQEGYDLWGDLCACSYGPAQIMWATAKDLGFAGHPLELWHGAVSLPYVVKLLNKNASQGGNTLQRLAASYNAGLGCLTKTSLWPNNYVLRFTSIYADVSIKYKQ